MQAHTKTTRNLELNGNIQNIYPKDQAVSAWFRGSVGSVPEFKLQISFSKNQLGKPSQYFQGKKKKKKSNLHISKSGK